MTEGMHERGVFIISIDVEFNWGRFDRSDREECWRLEEDGRRIIQELLELFEHHQVGATWALVGHLLLESCTAAGSRPHPEIRRPETPWFPDDWYRFDPCSNSIDAPQWYAPDVVRSIIAAGGGHEIASHSFAHILFGHPGCSAESAGDDLAAAAAAAREHNLALESMVFPRNSIGHLDLLSAHGFRAYRGEDPTFYRSWPRPLRRAAHFAADFLALPPPVSRPERVGSLWNIPGSMMLQGMDGLRALIPPVCRLARALSGLRRAARERSVFHLWFHPSNLAVGRSKLLQVLDRTLTAARQLEARGDLEILTMGDLATRLAARETQA